MNKRQKKKRKKLEDLYEGWEYVGRGEVSWKSKRKFDKEYKSLCDKVRHIKPTEREIMYF